MIRKNHSNNIFLFVGPSGSGKDTICNYLVDKYKFKKLKSYTTRPPRYRKEDTHIFISEKKFMKLKDICAYTDYCGHKYCATKKQIDKADLYIIDPAGIDFMRKCYNGNKRLVIVYIDTPFKKRVFRMNNRGDNQIEIRKRIISDEEIFNKIKDTADIILDNGTSIE